MDVGKTEVGMPPAMVRLSVPPAELSKGLVVTRPSRLNKIIIRTQGKDRRFLMAAVSRLLCEDPMSMPGGTSTILSAGTTACWA